MFPFNYFHRPRYPRLPRPVAPKLWRHGRSRPRVEALEERINPTVVYLDFGFAFPGGTLTVNNGDMGAVNGPDVFDDGHDLISLTTSVQNENIDLNDDSVADLVDAQILAGRIFDLVQREYAPFNVTVQMAAASSVEDIADTLDANGDGLGNRDAYVIVAGDDPDSNPALGWAPLDDGNDDDNTCFAFADEFLRSFGIDVVDTALGRTAAHEAGHTFGLEHTRGVDQSPTDQPMTQGDMMGAPVDVNGNNNNDGNEDNRQFGAIHIFTRFDLPPQDGTTFLNHYEELADPNVVGLAVGAPAYVTGTGANDQISIFADALNPGEATVTVLAFAAFDGTTFSNLIASTQYNIPLANGILVEAGFSTDQIIVDGTLGTVVTVRGMNGDDQLVVKGGDAPSGSYTPESEPVIGMDQNTYFHGQVIVTLDSGSTTINLEEFKSTGSVTVEDIDAFTFFSPRGADALIVDGPGGRNRIRGTVNSGTPFVPLVFNNLAALTIDTSNNEVSAPNDVIDLDSNFIAIGLQNVDLITGNGNDRVDVNVELTPLPVPGGSLDWDAGLGDDTLKDDSGTVNQWTVNGAGSGNLEGILFFAGVNNLEGSSNVDTFQFVGTGSVTGNVNGVGADDVLDYSAYASAVTTNLETGKSTGIGGTFTSIEEVIGSAQTDTLIGKNDDNLWTIDETDGGDVDGFEFSDYENLTGGSAVDTFVITPTGEVTGTVDGAGGDDTIDNDTATANTFNITGLNQGTSDEVANFKNVENLVGDSAADDFVFTGSGALDGTIDGEGGRDALDFSAVASVQVVITGLGPIDGFEVDVAGKFEHASNIDEVIGSAAGLTDRISGADRATTWQVRKGVDQSFLIDDATVRQLIFSNFEQLFGGDARDRLTVDFSAGNPVNPVVGLTYNGGLGVDDLTALGTAGEDRFKLNTFDLVVNDSFIHYAAVENIFARGGLSRDRFKSLIKTFGNGLTSVQFEGEGGGDRFRITPAVDVAFVVDGGSGTDKLVVVRDGAIYQTPMPLRSAKTGVYKFKNRLDLTFISIETIDLGFFQPYP